MHLSSVCTVRVQEAALSPNAPQLLFAHDNAVWKRASYKYVIYTTCMFSLQSDGATKEVRHDVSHTLRIERRRH